MTAFMVSSRRWGLKRFWVSPQRFAFRFSRRQQANECQDGCQRQIVADVLQAIFLRKPNGDIGRKRSAEDTRQVERQRTPRVTHRGGEKLGQHCTERTVE